MTKEQQDLAWQCLPKEAREEIRSAYFVSKVSAQAYTTPSWQTLELLYGYHNLTSDKEPPELLFVERKKVQEEYESYKEIIRWANDGPKGHKDKIRGKEVMLVLDGLFGDKCLPDKEPSVQVEPKFDIGQKVIVKFNGSIRKISSRKYTPKGYQYFFEGFDYADYSFEQGIEPYTEPKTKMKTLNESLPEAAKIIEDNFWDFVDSLETKDKMEKKELNLCELLKDCEGMEVYTTPYGELILKWMNEDLITLGWKNACETVFYHHNGRLYPTGDITLFPSRALYEKYPLDAYSAWMEWHSERTPKRWRAKGDETYLYIDSVGRAVEVNDTSHWMDNERYELGNYFRTEEEAQQAAEAVRECLMKFHQENV